MLISMGYQRVCVIVLSAAVTSAVIATGSSSTSASSTMTSTAMSTIPCGTPTPGVSSYPTYAQTATSTQTSASSAPTGSAHRRSLHRRYTDSDSESNAVDRDSSIMAFLQSHPKHRDSQVQPASSDEEKKSSDSTHSFSKLVALLKSANLDKDLDKLQEKEEGVVVFAPIDRAFSRFPFQMKASPNDNQMASSSASGTTNLASVCASRHDKTLSSSNTEPSSPWPSTGKDKSEATLLLMYHVHQGKAIGFPSSMVTSHPPSADPPSSSDTSKDHPEPQYPVRISTLIDGFDMVLDIPASSSHGDTTSTRQATINRYANVLSITRVGSGYVVAVDRILSPFGGCIGYDGCSAIPH
ncbi:hypothetical protein BSLG_006570 [Batrachochytrium salamandrivorans]|nr:hypothetical protein BSLG_006570 [Batrachochytrium salamandrivorans]